MNIGNVLKEARETKGLSLEAIEEQTNIRKKYLDALENENYELLPGRVYARGFLRNYASFLGLDHRIILKEFDQRYPVPITDSEQISAGPVKTERSIRRNFMVGLVAIALIAYIVYNPIGMGNQDSEIVPGANLNDNTGIIAEEQTGGKDNPVLTQGKGVRVVLNVVEQKSWISVEVDGVQTFQGTVYAGEAKEFKGTEKISLRLGNPGVVNVEYNGSSVGFLGDKGQPVSKEFVAPIENS
ncbi:MAG: helix-turn-helix domain-containing protein [Peptococcaceae bacterium]|nr:helix-turn-helix domain-containing protein [Peptococcaceae bacterium]